MSVPLEQTTTTQQQTPSNNTTINNEFSIYKNREVEILKQLEQQAIQDQKSEYIKKELILELANIYEWYAANGYFIHPTTTICSEILRVLKRKDINIDRTWVWRVLDARYKNLIGHKTSKSVTTQQIEDKNLLLDNKVLYEHKLEQLQDSTTNLEYLTDKQLKELYYQGNELNNKLVKIAVERNLHVTVTPDLKEMVELIKEQAKRRREKESNTRGNDNNDNSNSNSESNNSSSESGNDNSLSEEERRQEEDASLDDLLESAIRADKPYDLPIDNYFADMIEYDGKLSQIMAEYARIYPPSQEFIEEYGPLLAVKIYMKTPGTDMKSKRSFCRLVELGDIYDDHGKHGSSSLDKAVGMFKDRLTKEIVRVERSLTREHLGQKIPRVKDIRELLYEYLPGEYALTKWYEGDVATKHELSMQRFAVGHSVKLSSKLSDRSIGSH